VRELLGDSPQLGKEEKPELQMPKPKNQIKALTNDKNIKCKLIIFFWENDITRNPTLIECV